MFCRNCGTELKDDTLFCTNCGTPAAVTTPAPEAPVPPPVAPPVQPPYYQPTPVRYDDGSWGWFALGFFFPLVGLILYFVWKNDKPLSSKRAGIGALVGAIASAVLAVLWVVFIIILFMTEEYDPSLFSYYDSYYSSVSLLLKQLFLK